MRKDAAIFRILIVWVQMRGSGCIPLRGASHSEYVTKSCLSASLDSFAVLRVSVM